MKLNKKKKIYDRYILASILLSLVFHAIGEEKHDYAYLDKAFSYTLSQAVDVTTGFRPFGIELATNLKNVEFILSLNTYRNILKKDNEGKYFVGSQDLQKYIFLNGLMQSYYYSHSDLEPTITYEYDTSKRLVKMSDLTYLYPESEVNDTLKREVYQNGVSYETQKIQLRKDGFEIQFLKNNGSVSGAKYTYSEEKIIEFVQSDLKESNEWVEWDLWEFIYKDDLLFEVINKSPKDNAVRSHRKVIALEDKNIIELEITRWDPAGRHVDVWLFFDYDQYGNWTKAEKYAEGVLVEKHERDIEYIE